VTAIESGLLDLLGQHLDVPVAALLGEGHSADAVQVLGYLFYVADRKKTDLPYASEPQYEGRLAAPAARAGHDGARHRAPRRSGAGALRLSDFKLKGGVLAGEAEVEAIVALHERFPKARVTLDRMAAGC